MANKKQQMNDLLSRFDTLHDFCDPDPGTGRNKDKDIDSKDSKALTAEFNDVFKPEILKAFDTEDNVKDFLSRRVLEKNIKDIIRDCVVGEVARKDYQTDFSNLVDRTKNGLCLINGIFHTDKDTYKKTHERATGFEPTVVAFYEFLWNLALPEKQDSIGRFISNKNLPIFDYVNHEKKYLSRSTNTYVKDVVPGRAKDYITSSEPALTSFVTDCVEAKEPVVAFILGTVNTDDKADVFLSNADSSTSGFYKLQPPNTIIKGKKERTTQIEKDKLANTYNRYLTDLRKILGLYFEKPDDCMIYLIVDTTNISFSKYYMELRDDQKKELKLMVLCNAAMNWDGANSAECKKREGGPKGEETIKHTKDGENRAVYDVHTINLQSQEPLDHITGTDVQFDEQPSQKYRAQHMPREVAQISECIRQQINKKRQKSKECSVFSSKARLLDMKRSGDALQALMAKKLNEERGNKNEFYVFVTLDHLAFLKARLNGIPTVYTSVMRDKIVEKVGGKDKTTTISNRVMVLFKNGVNRNYKSIANQLESNIVKFRSLEEELEDTFPIISLISDESFYNMCFARYQLLLDYLVRRFFGIVLYARPTTAVPQTPNDFKVSYWWRRVSQGLETFQEDDFKVLMDARHTIIRDNLEVFMKESLDIYQTEQSKPSNIDDVKQKLIMQTHKSYYDKSIVRKLEAYIAEEIKLVVADCNAKINEVKAQLERIAKEHDVTDFSLKGGLLDDQKIIDDVEQYILNSLIIECFYTLKRTGVFINYTKDLSICRGNMKDAPDLIKKLGQDAPEDGSFDDDANKASKYLELVERYNDKYAQFTTGSNPDKIKLIGKAFEGSEFRIEDDEFKNDMNTLYGFNIGEYIDKVSEVVETIQKVYDKEIKTRLDAYVKKFESADYFVEPKFRSRSTLTVAQKMDECMEYFASPTRLQLVYSDLFYGKIHRMCEQFYRGKLSELHLAKITAKAVKYEQMVKNVINDDAKLRKREVVVGGAEEIQKGGFGNERMIKQIITLLRIDDFKPYLLAPETYEPDEYPFTDDDLLRYSILKRYTSFLEEIYRRGEMVYPLFFEIPEVEWEATWKTEWKLSVEPKSEPSPINSAILRIDYKDLLELWFRQATTKEDGLGPPLKDEEYEDLLAVNLNVRVKGMQTFTYHILSDLFRQCIDGFYKFIGSMYTKRYSFGFKEKNALFDMIVWMMINDPGVLLNHPNRSPDWAYYERSILNDLYDKGGMYIASGIEDDVGIKQDEVDDKPDVWNGLGGDFVPKNYIDAVQRVIYRDRANYGKLGRNRPPRMVAIRGVRAKQNVKFEQLLPYLAKETRENKVDACPQPADKFQVLADNMQMLGISSDSKEYVGCDEFSLMKCVFEREGNFLLKANLGILSSLDPRTGGFKTNIGNIFQADTSERLTPALLKKVLEAKEHIVPSLREGQHGGGFETLSDYHRKYYKIYYDMYYS